MYNFRKFFSLKLNRIKNYNSDKINTCNTSSENISGMEILKQETVPFNPKKIAKCLYGSETYYNGSVDRKKFIDNSILRLYRVFTNIILAKQTIKIIKGPVLDVSSGWGMMYPLFKKYFNDALPYDITELNGWDIVIDGQSIRCHKFECEKELLEVEDFHYGIITFIDCLEHLIVDPIWTLLEFNRVLHKGGFLMLATPNVSSACRVLSILSGNTPATESEIKPSSIYQRHNREWTPVEVKKALEVCGFGNFHFTTNHYLLKDDEKKILQCAADLKLLKQPIYYYGPEIFIVAEKVQHKTLNCNLPKEERWPEWLYTPFDNYRKRPSLFPIVWTDDYS